jgi:hypothetical protein
MNLGFESRPTNSISRTPARRGVRFFRSTPTAPQKALHFRHECLNRVDARGLAAISGYSASLFQRRRSYVRQRQDMGGPGGGGTPRGLAPKPRLRCNQKRYCRSPPTGAASRPASVPSAYRLPTHPWRSRPEGSGQSSSARRKSWALVTRLNLTPGQQPTALRIDHLEPDRTQPVANGQHRDVVEDRVLIVGALQVVVGDFCAEMVT